MQNKLMMLAWQSLVKKTKSQNNPMVLAFWLFFVSLLLFHGNWLYSLDTENNHKLLRTNRLFYQNSHLNAQKSNYHLRENTDVRIRLKELFYLPYTEALKIPPNIYNQRDGNMPVLFSIRLKNDQPNKLYYVFLNRTYQDNGKIDYPISSRGSYSIRRDTRKNRIDQIKIFLNENIGNAENFIRIFPTNNGYSEIEVVVFNREIYSRTPISITFDSILTMPFRQFLEMTNRYIQWDNLLSNPTLLEWRLVEQIPNRLRPYLDNISEVYDGAMDINGNFVRIETGKPLKKPGFNCSGFIKWVADGVYRSRKEWLDEQMYLDIEVLKQHQIEIRGAENPWNSAKESVRDPYFGLDWARAIAQKLLELEMERPLAPYTGDVQKIPFFNYLKNVGYPITDLNAMMYLLAIQNPGTFYLGAINGDFGEPPLPSLHQYYHEVALFPYFDQNGIFKLVVMDTGVERDNGYLENKYQNEYIHLSRIKAPYEYIVAPFKQKNSDKL